MQTRYVRTFADLAADVRLRSPRVGISTIIGVDGCGGSGKSTFAARLAKALNGAPIVHTDDFASWENAIDWWPRLLEQVLAPLATNHAALYQRYDWAWRELSDWISIVPGGVILIEGVTATRPEFADYLSYRIWIDCSAGIRLQRGLERDGAEALPLWQKWMKEEDEYVARRKPQAMADLVVDGNPAMAHDMEKEFIAAHPQQMD